MTNNLREVVGEYKPNNLFAGTGFPVQVGSVILLAGQGLLLQGSLIAKNAEGKGKLIDGTEGLIADAILTDDVDTGTEDSKPAINATVYVSGVFNRQAIILGGSEKIGTHESTLKTKGIYLKDNL